MKKVVTCLNAEYGRYIDTLRAIPWLSDALKPVERRVLLVAYEEAATKLTKCAKIVGAILGKYHPHGDSSCYGTLVGLVNRGLLIGQGNFGAVGLIDMNPAAYRYCILGDSLITTDIGDIRLIDLANISDKNKINVLSANGEINTASKFFDSGVHPILEIKTKFGGVLRGSYNHPIQITLSDLSFKWVTLEDLIIGDIAHRIVNGKKIYDPIIEINKCKDENVYSIKVDSNCHSFVSNGFISHNTEAKCNPSVTAMFKDHLKFVEWKTIELEPEPMYLPSVIPIGLVGEGVIHGIGYHTVKVPRYAYSKLIARLQSLLRDDEFPAQIIPDIANCNLYENEPGSFEQILTTGIACIQVVPKTTISSDKKSLFVHARNPNTGFSKLINYCTKFEEDNGYSPFTILDITENNILKLQIIPNNKQLVTAAFELQILKLVSCKLHVKCNFVDRDMTVKLFSIDDVLLNCFSNYRASWLAKLKHDKSNLSHKLYELNVVLVIRDIISNNPTVNKIADILKIYKTSYSQIHNFLDTDVTSVCSKYTIKKLIETKIDIQEIQNAIQNVDNQIVNHDQIVFDHVQSM